MESLEEQHHWVAEEAEYQVYKYQQFSIVCPVLEMHEEGAKPSLISGSQKRNVIVHVKCASKNTQFRNVARSKECNIERSGRWRRNLDCVNCCLGKGHLDDSSSWSRECGIEGCKDRHHRLLHEEKVTPGSMEGKADTPVAEENKSSMYETV